jgi:hypothetical protein
MYQRMGFEPVPDKNGKITKMLVREQRFLTFQTHGCNLNFVRLKVHNQAISILSNSMAARPTLYMLNCFGSSHRYDHNDANFTFPLCTNYLLS